MRRLLPLLGIPSASLAFYPFGAEDAQTLGGFGRFQAEANLVYFRYYDKTKHRDVIVQITAGLTEKMDLAVLLPYSYYRYTDSSSLEGFNDVGVFLKHVPLKFGSYRLGYKAQINLDTGREGIGYGKTTANLNLILEREFKNFTFNTNLVYTKASYAEELRDSYGFYLHVYGSVNRRLTAGAEFKYLVPEDKHTNKKDMHILIGALFHLTEKADVSLGFHKSLNRHGSFADYGLLAGFLWRF